MNIDPTAAKNALLHAIAAHGDADQTRVAKAELRARENKSVRDRVLRYGRALFFVHEATEHEGGRITDARFTRLVDSFGRLIEEPYEKHTDALGVLEPGRCEWVTP